ncbi:hypothetical protein BOTCAL_0151g00270 [Botryotinia calthae]|uniref:Uncharacterized protein n=1 Tax=Botryotinia calthae TaxID=38488 RepID=A0A4Y8D522_9HELO|nr:hypothetical protein BOTCAL_0151g00270 [Botryotinia calthae]
MGLFEFNIQEEICLHSKALGDELVLKHNNAALHPTREEDVNSIPKIVGFAMAIVSGWVVWIMPLGWKTLRVNKGGVAYSCMTRVYRIYQAKQALDHQPRVDLKKGIRRSGESFAVRNRKTDWVAGCGQERKLLATPNDQSK